MSKTLWRHALFLSLLSAAYIILSATYSSHWRAPRVTWHDAFLSSLLNAEREVLLYVILASGIAVTTSGITRHTVRSCVILCASLTVMIIVEDMYLGPALVRANQRAAHRITWPLQGDTLIREAVDTLGSIRTGLKILITQPAELHEKLSDTGSPNHARAQATHAAVALPRLFVPFALIGTMLGAVTWMRRHVRFPLPRDEIVARWTLAWVLGSFIWDALSQPYSFWSIEYHFRPYWWPLYLTAPFVVIAALGWRLAARPE